jgi:hypothetical protein
MKMARGMLYLRANTKTQVFGKYLGEGTSQKRGAENLLPFKVFQSVLEWFGA